MFHDALVPFAERWIITMKKWIKADNGRVTQVIEFDDGSKIELPLDKNGNLKWFDDSKLIKKAS